jgi:hypothetical protein
MHKGFRLIMNTHRNSSITVGLILMTFSIISHAAEIKTVVTLSDPHYTDGGFFDVHVCNWPKRPLFFLTLWSTTKYKSLKKVEIMGPNGKKLGYLDLSKYRLVKKKGKPEKHVFIKHFEIPKGFGNGFYTAKATFNNGKQYIAKDYVIIQAMQRATHTYPANNQEDIPVNAVLKWDPVPGAHYYQVFLTDSWEGEQIFKSGFITAPKLILPKGLLKPDGLYEWRIHSRDVNGNYLLGDFDYGSLTGKMQFTTAGQ